MESEPGWKLSAHDDTQIRGLPYGTSCQQLDAVIRRRRRGFMCKGDSLPKMLRRNGLMPPKPEELSEERVCAAIMARMESEPSWRPSTTDDTQIPDLPSGTNCKQLNTAIRRRLRGFTHIGDALFSMLRRNGVIPPEPGNLSETLVCDAIRARMKSEPGWRPSVRDDTQIPGLPLGTSCQQLGVAICQRLRGFVHEGDSLLKMLRRNGITRDCTFSDTCLASAARV
jgi:hypothetical protein